MTILVWILSGALAAVYLLVGFLKLITPREKLLKNDNMGWVNDFTSSQVKGIGLAELLGAVGVIVPWLTGIVPVLTPIAALGLVALQVGAMITHARRGEQKVLPGNASLLLLALVVAVIRFTQL
jgi:hypothetical protein